MAANPAYHERLRELISREAVRYGEVKLSKGGTSHYYIDCRRVTTHPEGAFLAAEVILDLLAGEEVDAVGGPTLGADPIVGAVCYASHCRNHPLRGFIVRKSAKEHGLQKVVEGQLREGDRVAVVEDVVTTGGSVLEAVRAVEQEGAKVVRIMALVDRLEGARERFEEAGYRFTPVLTLADLTIRPAPGKARQGE